MPDSSQVLKILLQVQADVADLGKVSAGLKDVEAQATQTATAVNAAGNGAAASAGAGAGTTETVALSDAAQGRLTTEERISSIITQRQILVDLELEKVEALAAGEAAQAAALGAELELRQASLQIQTAARISEDEALVIAQRRIAAQAEITAATAAGAVATQGVAEGGLLASINLNKARNEATTLTRQLVTGSVSGRTLGALLGSLGPQLGIAGIAAYALIKWISSSYDASAKLLEATAKENDELEDQKEKWNAIAAEAGTFADVVRLGEQEVSALDKEAQKLNTILEKQATWWQKINILHASAGQAVAANAGIPANSGPSNADIDQARDAQAQALIIQGMLKTKTAIDDAAAASVAFYQKLDSGTPSDALAQIAAKLRSIGAEEQQLQAVVEKGKKYLPGGDPSDVANAVKAENLIVDLQGQTVKLTAERKKYTDEITKGGVETSKVSLQERQATLDAAKLDGDNVTAAQHKLSVEEKIADLTKSNAQALKDGQVTQSQINALAEKEVTNAEQTKAAAIGTRDAHKEISAAIRDEGIQLQAIKGYMQVIDSDPFATVFQKADAQAKLIPAAMQSIAASSQRLKDDIKGGALDPQQLEAARQKLVQNDLEVIKLGNDFKKLGFGGTLQADLTSWANQFGTTAHQVANAITSTIGSAVSGLSNAITGLIFKTTTWKQAFSEAAQAIVGDIVNIVLQWAAQQAVMLVLHAVFGESSAATSASTAAQTAAAWAPAATAASIATEGEADLAGTTALGIAMAAGQGIVTGLTAAGGGFAEGGFTGGVAGQVAGIVHGREFVFDDEATRNAGVANLQRIHQAYKRGTPGFAAGGYVGALPSASGRQGGSAMKQTLIFVSEMKQAIKEHLKSTDGHKAIINAITGARYELGLAK